MRSHVLFERITGLTLFMTSLCPQSCGRLLLREIVKCLPNELDSFLNFYSAKKRNYKFDLFNISFISTDSNDKEIRERNAPL